MSTIIFDLETTGLLLPSTAPIENQPKIIEIGAIKVSEGKEIGTFHQLVNPQEPLTKKIKKITKIEDEQLQDAPLFEEVLPDLREFFCDGTELVTHNAPFDSGVLNIELQRRGVEDFPWPRDIICSVQEYYHVFGKRLKLTDLYYNFVGEPLNQTHRALDDVRALYLALQKGGFFG